MAHDAATVLPASVVGPADVARLKRALETFDDASHQAELRAKSGAEYEVTGAGRLLSELAAANDANLELAADREKLLALLTTVLETAPVVTMSFAVDPSAAFMAKIAGWLRLNIDPLVLVRVGLQPSIAAGCTLRTTSKVYDFSLRSRFSEQRELLLNRLRTPRPMVDTEQGAA